MPQPYLHLFRLRFLLLCVSARGFLILLVHLHLVLANKRYADRCMTSRGNKNWLFLDRTDLYCLMIGNYIQRGGGR